MAPEKGQEGPHAIPNSDIIPAHLAVKALVQLHAADACLAAIDSENSTLACWALQYMHDPKVVTGLIDAYQKTQDKNLRTQLLTTLARLYKEEAPYDGSWWWSTRPDTRGPYYKPITWAASDQIQALLIEEWAQAGPAEKGFFADLNTRFRMGIDRFGGESAPVATEEVTIDLNKIKNKKGQIGKTSIEDVMLAMASLKGDPSLGKKLFTQQGCVACHSIEKGEALKGPFMGQIGSIMNRKQIAESILKPNASISQGFASVQVTTRDGKNFTGFITGESADKVVLRDITGKAHTIPTADIQSRKELQTSMMPSGLADALSYEEFASLITFLSEQKN